MREQETIRTLVDMLSASQAECRALRTTGIQVHSEDYVAGLQKDLDEAGDAVCERDERIQALEAENAKLRRSRAQERAAGGIEVVHESEAVEAQRRLIQAAEDALTEAGVLAEHGNLADRIEALVDLERTWNGRVKDTERHAELLKETLKERDGRVSELEAQNDTLTKTVEEQAAKVGDLEEQVAGLVQARDDWRDRAAGEERAHRAALARVQGVLDDAGVSAGGPLMERVRDLVHERDALKEGAG